MIIEFTQDIPPDVEASIAAGWREIAFVDEVRHKLMRSVLPPSWIAVITGHTELQLALGAEAIVFLTEIVKEAAKATWRSRITIAKALRSAAVWPLRRAAEVLWEAHENAPRHPSIVISLTVAEYTAASCKLSTGSLEDLALELALFVRLAPRLAAELKAIEESGERAVGDYIIELREDGTAIITWMARESLEQLTRAVGERVAR